MRLWYWLCGLLSEIVVGLLWLTLVPVVAVGFVLLMIILYGTSLILNITPSKASGPLLTCCREWVK